MDYASFLNWVQGIISSMSEVGSWLITPIELTNDLALSPLMLISATGLILFIGVALIKWVIS